MKKQLKVIFMEGYEEHELPKREERFKVFDIVIAFLFGGLVTLGLIFMIRLLLLKP